jgi:hypothetical protein
MDTTTTRKQFSFILPVYLIEAMDREAIQTGRSRNAHLERILQQQFPDAVEDAGEGLSTPRARKASRRETARA